MIPRLRRSKRQSGSTLLEMVLATVTILTILFLIIDVGRALYAYDWVARMARQGARYAIVRGTFCNTTLSGCPATNDGVQSYVKNFDNGLVANHITVTTKCNLTGAATDTDPPCASPGYVKVTVKYTFSFVSPFIPLSWDMHSVSEQVVQN